MLHRTNGMNPMPSAKPDWVTDLRCEALAFFCSDGPHNLVVCSFRMPTACLPPVSILLSMVFSI